MDNKIFKGGFIQKMYKFYKEKADNSTVLDTAVWNRERLIQLVFERRNWPLWYVKNAGKRFDPFPTTYLRLLLLGRIGLWQHHRLLNLYVAHYQYLLTDRILPPVNEHPNPQW